MDRFVAERFVASPPGPALPTPRFRGQHDLGPGLRRWIDNRSRPPGLLLVQHLAEGAMLVRWQGRMLAAAAPCLVLTAFGEDSEYGTPDRLGPGYRSAWLNFDGVGLRQVADRLREGRGPVWGDADGVLAARLRPLLAPAALRLPAPVLARLGGDLLLALLDQGGRPRTGVAAAALAAVAADPCQRWNLAALAAAHGCSRAQLFRAARQRWGVGLKRWLDLQRLQRAEVLLRQGGQRSAAVARAVGYGSAQVLNRRLRAWRRQPDPA